jgi:hypothetical protein
LGGVKFKKSGIHNFGLEVNGSGSTISAEAKGVRKNTGEGGKIIFGAGVLIGLSPKLSKARCSYAR